MARVALCVKSTDAMQNCFICITISSIISYLQVSPPGTGHCSEMLIFDVSSTVVGGKKEWFNQ